MLPLGGGELRQTLRVSWPKVSEPHNLEHYCITEHESIRCDDVNEYNDKLVFVVGDNGNTDVDNDDDGANADRNSAGNLFFNTLPPQNIIISYVVGPSICIRCYVVALWLGGWSLMFYTYKNWVRMQCCGNSFTVLMSSWLQT